MLKKIILWFRKHYRRFINIRRMIKAKKKLDIAFKEQIIARRKLRNDINAFLRVYFGVDARSKFIPKDFKNSEEVKVAIIDKFGDTMSSLNVSYNDLYK